MKNSESKHNKSKSKKIEISSALRNSNLDKYNNTPQLNLDIANMLTSQSAKKKSVINWHDYAEIRKSFLPNILNKEPLIEEEPRIKNLKKNHSSQVKLPSMPNESEPPKEKYLNYVIVKEQQSMKRSRMKLLNSLDKQKFKFKYNTLKFLEENEQNEH